MDHGNVPDDQLVARLGGADVAAFEALYRRYGDLIFSTCLRIVGEVQCAEDLTQEIFLRVWRKPQAFDPARGKFATWLLSVARNRAVDEVRSRGRRRRREAPPELDPEDTPSLVDDEDPAYAAQLADDRALVVGALRSLPPEQRRALELAYFGGMTQQEIATALGQPLGTVKTRIRLGMRKLRLAILGSAKEDPLP